MEIFHCANGTGRGEERRRPKFLAVMILMVDAWCLLRYFPVGIVPLFY